jgi:translation initiation factor IF-2
VKVKDLAQELGKKPKDFMKLLTEFNIKVKSGNTKLDDETITVIKDLFNEDKSEDSQKDSEKVTEQKVLTKDQIQISEFAKLIDTPLKNIMEVILNKGLLLNLNSTIDTSLAKDIATDLEIDLLIESEEATSPNTTLKDQLNELNDIEDTASLRSRPPIITVMGHVDHGKTLLLDKIRESNIVNGESGGITQHIGAYQVRLKNKKKMTFLDTPGHEAFTSLRSRGSQITDIAILVIAADDGMKPQSIEAMNHAKAAETPIIVAINKIDVPGADIEKVKQQLVEHDLVPEEWGGTTVICTISAKTGEGIDNLLDMINLTAEVLELKTSYDGLAKAVTIESFLDKQRGPITTVLIQSGKLAIGNHVAIGGIYGKMRALYNDIGESITEALPSTPVKILGLSNVPTPGDILETYPTEQAAKNAAANNLETKKQTQRIVKNVSLNTLSQQITDGDVKQVNLIIKTDVHGSLEALILSIQQIESDDIAINILHSATGSVTENDILLAKAADAIVIGFRVSTTQEAKQAAEKDKVDIRTYEIIYEILDDITKVLAGLDTITKEEVKIGEAEVRDVFSFSKVGVIAGSYVTDGKLIRNSTVKVLRKDEELFSGKLTSLKRFKDDVRQVETKYECGIVIQGFSKFEVGDTIECYSSQEG